MLVIPFHVRMGTLAGSTVMLLTVPWSASMWLARCDIRTGEAIDKKLTRPVWGNASMSEVLDTLQEIDVPSTQTCTIQASQSIMTPHGMPGWHC